MQTIQIYIDNKRLEMFDDESVELTSSIQDVRDISKIFTDYSQSFTVPASKNNNKIFKHYYDNALVDGYDARFRSNSEIQLNHTPFRKGTIRLNKVVMKSNKAYAYDLTFFGSTVTLNRILGEKRLNSLTKLTAYNHDWNFANVKQGIETGLVVGSDDEAIIYPLISPNKRFIYNSNGLYVTPENYRNLGNAATGEGLFKADLKPAIRAIHIIEAIEAQYPELQFSRNFFGEEVFNELYLWLNREAGELGNSKGKYEVEKGIILTWNGPTSGTDYFVLDGKNTVRLGAITTSNSTETSSFQLNIETVSSEVYDIVVYNNVTNIVTNQTTRSVLYEYKGLTNNQSVSETIVPGTFNYNEVYLQFEVKSFSAIEFTSTLDLEFLNNGSIVEARQYSAGTDESGIVSTLDFVNVAQEMPNIKIIDFLTGLFKMFNLTAYVEDGIIVVQDLNAFYASPPNPPFDITEYIDVETSSVKRLDLYSNIKYEFREPSTRLAVKFDELFDFPFGHEEFNVVIDGKYIDGQDYLVQLPFEKVIYEKLLDDNDDVYTNIQYGYFVSENDEPIKGSPLLFYNCRTEVYIAKPLNFKSDDGITNYELEFYNRPSNVKQDGTQTLNFDAENDEFTVGLTTPSYNEFSLFKNYHEDYIKNIFDSQSRMFEVSALLPIKVLRKYRLNDRFVINGKQYTINSVSSNLMSGRSNLELISELVEPFVQPRNIIISFGSYASGLDVPITVSTFGGCDGATIQWSTDASFPNGGTPVTAACSGDAVITMPNYGTFYYRAFSVNVNDPSNTAISNIISKTIVQAIYYTPETLKFGTTDVLACSGSNVTLYISSGDGLYYDSNSGSGSLVSGSFYSDGNKVYTFVDGVKNDTGYCFSYSAQVFKYAIGQQDSCSGVNTTVYYNPTNGLYYTAGDGTGALFSGSYYSNGNFIYSFSSGVKTQVANCDTFTSEPYTYDANITNVCDSTLAIDLYISTNDGLYYYGTSGIGNPVSGGYYFNNGNIYSFSNGIRTLVNPCAETPEPGDFVYTVDTRLPGNNTNYYRSGVLIGSASSAISAFTVFWGDGSSQQLKTSTVHTYTTAGIYTIIVRGPFNDRLFRINDSQKTLSVEQWGGFRLETLSFIGANSLDLSATIGIPTIGSSGIPTNLSAAFSGCRALTTINNVSSWDVSNIYNLSNMFADCTNLTMNISSWDTSKATNMIGMFAYCKNINMDLSGWNVSKVTKCTSFSLDTPKWTLPKPNFTNCTP